jgi:LmbE family N-acetylglucosaminyl deacetylase
MREIRPNVAWGRTSAWFLRRGPEPFVSLSVHCLESTPKVQKMKAVSHDGQAPPGDGSRRSASPDVITVPCDESLHARWDRAVATATRWRPPRTRTVVISPHPDDETLGCGGLIAFQRRRCEPVLVVAVSDGEAAYADQPADAQASTRRREQCRALKRLGVSTRQTLRLGLPDGQTHAHVDTLARQLGAIIRSGDLVVVPWVHDHHCDHVACARAAFAATQEKSASLVGTLFWAYHYTSPGIDPDTAFLRLDLDDDLVIRRAEALACHASQLSARDAANTVLKQSLLRPLGRNVELYAIARL